MINGAETRFSSESVSRGPDGLNLMGYGMWVLETGRIAKTMAPVSTSQSERAWDPQSMDADNVINAIHAL